MLPFHDKPMIRENIIAKIPFASCSAKISRRENFHVYGSLIAYHLLILKFLSSILFKLKFLQSSKFKPLKLSHPMLHCTSYMSTATCRQIIPVN